MQTEKNMAAATTVPVKCCNRWSKAYKSQKSTQVESLPIDVSPPPKLVAARPQKVAPSRSFILQHYHSTGCAGGAFSWRAALMNPEKALVMCTERREYRQTTIQDVQISKEDKRRGGGPRVGPFQMSIPGAFWKALPKYDFTTRKRSSAFNERMHVEWENHVDHILQNGGELPTASVVAKAGFRSCAPCCRDMLALAHPTGKTFIMVDLAEDDERGTFHFVMGDQYIPVPKEACSLEEVAKLKKVVQRAQDGMYASTEAIHAAVKELNVPVDEVAQAMYLKDPALLPAGCARNLQGTALLKVLHAEHFARLAAEYGASILRNVASTATQQQAIQNCRKRAYQMILDAWGPCMFKSKIDLRAYAVAAISPLLPEDPTQYGKHRRTVYVQPMLPLTCNRVQQMKGIPATVSSKHHLSTSFQSKSVADDNVSLADASTVAPDDTVASLSDCEDPEEQSP